MDQLRSQPTVVLPRSGVSEREEPVARKDQEGRGLSVPAARRGRLVRLDPEGDGEAAQAETAPSVAIQVPDQAVADLAAMLVLHS